LIHFYKRRRHTEAAEEEIGGFERIDNPSNPR